MKFIEKNEMKSCCTELSNMNQLRYIYIYILIIYLIIN